jgi:hypothetical protein
MDIISSALKAMTPIFEISLRVDLQIGFKCSTTTTEYAPSTARSQRLKERTRYH